MSSDIVWLEILKLLKEMRGENPNKGNNKKTKVAEIITTKQLLKQQQT